MLTATITMSSRATTPATMPQAHFGKGSFAPAICGDTTSVGATGHAWVLQGLATGAGQATLPAADLPGMQTALGVCVPPLQVTLHWPGHWMEIGGRLAAESAEAPAYTAVSGG